MPSGKYEGLVEVPDSMVPFVGVRAWSVNKTLRNEERLFSVYKTGTNWPVGRKLEAQCINPSFIWAGLRGHVHPVPSDDPAKKLPPHDAPYNDCMCGIYALNSDLDGEEVTPWQKSAVRGVVLLWGHVLEGERGWRAQYAKPVALLSDSEDPGRVQLVRRMADLYRLRVIASLEEEIDSQRKRQGGISER